MSHMVIFQSLEGNPGYNQFESIDEAVSFVEKIRNDQGIDSIRIFELKEVKFELKPYYKVELQALQAGSPEPEPQPEPTPPASTQPSAPPPPVAPPVADPAESSTSPFSPPSAVPSDPGASDLTPPVPPADQPDDLDQPTRRGLFGR